ncbi:hypothetical protein TNCV_2117961 [Trichonephila clavipes]|nr:hypothetical protein TNCV_2117961 [Trichonephila clavipes]
MKIIHLCAFENHGSERSRDLKGLQAAMNNIYIVKIMHTAEYPSECCNLVDVVTNPATHEFWCRCSKLPVSVANNPLSLGPIPRGGQPFQEEFN